VGDRLVRWHSVAGSSAVCLFVGALVLGSGAAAAAQESQLPELPLEELMRFEVQRVFGASERLQPVTEAPSSVTIVTAEDISRYGYRTLADILRGVRGFYVTDDRNYSYVGARGFGRAGDYNTRVLLLIDGHRVNDNIYDQAPVGADFPIDPAVFARVEIIRGPASSLYGTSAFFAVVNVVTRTGQSMNGVSATADVGTLGARQARVSAGREFDSGVDLALSGSYEQSDGMRQLYYPAFAGTPSNGIADGLDGERFGSVYGQFKFNGLTIFGTVGERHKDVPTASFDTIFNMQDPRERTSDRRALIHAEFDRAIGATRVMVGTSYDRYDYVGYYPESGDNPAFPVLLDSDAANGARWGVDGRITRTLPASQTLTVGGEFFDNILQRQVTSYNDPTVEGLLVAPTSTQGGVFVQDEIRVRPWLLLTGGLRHDRFASTGRSTPRGAIIVLPSPNASLKYLYGRAFRAPNAYERFYYDATPATPRPESIVTHEVVWEQYVGEWLRTSISGYAYRASDLISLTAFPTEGAGDALGFVNEGGADAKGIELEAEVRSKHGAQAVASYGLQRATDRATGTVLPNSPENVFKIKGGLPLRTAGSFASMEFQYLGRRSTLGGGGSVAPAAVVSATLLHPLGRSLQLTVAARNLFDAIYADPASAEHRQDSIEQNGRTIRVGLRWTLWQP
jgi:outer membrane receptor protein involved in Fe transport